MYNKLKQKLFCLRYGHNFEQAIANNPMYRQAINVCMVCDKVKREEALYKKVTT